MSLKFGLFFAGAWCFAAKFALAQQFPFQKTAYEALGLSQPCFKTINTTVACSDKLARHIVWEYVLQPTYTHPRLSAPPPSPRPLNRWPKQASVRSCLEHG